MTNDRKDSTDVPLERFARVMPPAGHAARVRARSGPAADSGAVRGTAWRSVPLGWALAIATSAIVIAAVGLSVEAPHQVELSVPPAATEWAGKPLDLPVLPPPAYWAMSAIEEFERLRPSRPPISPSHSAGALPPTVADVDLPTVGSTARQSSLPPIVIENIAPEPIQIADLIAPEPILLEAIVITPIEVAPLGQEDK